MHENNNMQVWFDELKKEDTLLVVMVVLLVARVEIFWLSDFFATSYIFFGSIWVIVNDREKKDSSFIKLFFILLQEKCYSQRMDPNRLLIRYTEKY